VEVPRTYNPSTRLCDPPPCIASEAAGRCPGKNTPQQPCGLKGRETGRARVQIDSNASECFGTSRNRSERAENHFRRIRMIWNASDSNRIHPIGFLRAGIVPDAFDGILTRSKSNQRVRCHSYASERIRTRSPGFLRVRFDFYASVSSRIFPNDCRASSRRCDSAASASGRMAETISRREPSSTHRSSS
jgi:hypothetical protein